MRILLAGTPEMVVPLFERIRIEGASAGIEIVGVATNPPRARGRHSNLQRTAVGLWAQSLHLTLFERGDCEEYASLLADLDAVFVVAYGKLIPEKYLNLPRCGWINLHFSHLPIARGAAPVQRLIAASRTEIGSTLFRLDKGMDTGPIYKKYPLVSIAGMNTSQVWESLITQSCESIVADILSIGAGLRPTEQTPYDDDAELAHAPKITSEEARVDWTESAEAIHQMILAFNPAPSAWSIFRTQRLLIHKAQVVNDASSVLRPGEMRVLDGELFVGTGRKVIKLIEVQPAGKRSMDVSSWLRGLRLITGESFE